MKPSVEGLARLFLAVLLILMIVASTILTAEEKSHAIKLSLLPEGWGSIDSDLDGIDDALENMNGSSMVTAYFILSRDPSGLDRRMLRDMGLEIKYVYRYVLKGFLVKASVNRLIDAFKAYRYIDVDGDGYSDALFIEKTRTYKARAYWSVRQIDVRPKAWNQGYLGKGVRVAVLDTGIDLSGRGFNNSGVEFYDLVNGYNQPYDDYGHGTLVSYIIAGNITPRPSLGEDDDEVLTTYITYIKRIQTTQYYYVTGPLMITGDSPSLKFYAEAVLYNKSAQGVAGFIDSAYLVHYPSYVINDFNAYDQVWGLAISYVQLSNGYYLANLTLSSPINNPPKGLYYVWIRFASGYEDYMAEVMGVARIPIMRDDTYPLHSGTAPEAGLVVFKVGDYRGYIDTGLAAQALDKLAQWNSDNDPSNDTNIASMSFGGTSDDPALHDAIVNALNHGILSVVAAGNDGYGSNYAGNTYPAAYPEVLTVAATNTIGNITDYSSQGGGSSYNSSIIKPDVAAPGGSYYASLTMRDSDQDGDVFFETGESYEVADNDVMTDEGTSFATPHVSGLAALIVEVLKEHGVWRNDAFHALLVKAIIASSAYETYPLVREDAPNYSPTLDHGGKDPHEGYGFIDGYAAIRLAGRIADYLEYVYGLKNNSAYDYSPNDNVAPLITACDDLREGVVYGVSDINNYLRTDFGPSSLDVPAHLERFTWNTGEVIHARYGARLLVTTSDQADALYDLVAYMYDPDQYDLVLLNHTSASPGAIDEYIAIKPPGAEETDDYIYVVSARRSSEDSPGGSVRLYIGPGLMAKFTYGRYIWVNTTAAASTSMAPYALIVVYYVKPGETTAHVYEEAPTVTSSLNGLAHVEGYVRIVYDSALQDDYDWYVGVVYTRDKRTLSNLTSSSVVEGPVVVALKIGEPVNVGVSGPSTVLDNTLFKLTAHLALNDTGQPLPGKPVYFYRSTNLSSWELIGVNTTDSNGYATFKTRENWSGVYYYMAYYPGDNDTQYNYSRTILAVSVYLQTATSVTISNNTPYTVQPVNITVRLSSLINGAPLAGENVTIWYSGDGGSSWSPLVEGITDRSGFFNYTAFFLVSGDYLLKANYSGNPERLYLSSQSGMDSLTSRRTPSNASVTPNSTLLRVYDTVGFLVGLNYTCPGGEGPIASAPVQLQLYNETGGWVTVDTEYTGEGGYAVLPYTFHRNGTYTFRISYPGNEIFEPYTSLNYTVTVKSLSTSISIINSPNNVYVGEVVRVEARVLDGENRGVPMKNATLQKKEADGWVDVVSNGTDRDGYVLFKWVETGYGNYTYRIYYPGMDYVYLPSYSDEFNITVEKLTTRLVLAANTTTTMINETVEFAAKLTNDSIPVSGETIYLQLLTSSGWVNISSASTNTSGYAVFDVSMRYAGNYTFRAYYPGSKEYDPAVSNVVRVEYRPLPTRIILILPPSAYTVDEVLVTARLEASDGAPLTGMPVYFWVSSNGSSWRLIGVNTTGPGGIALFKYRFWVNGMYIVKANYSDPGKPLGEWEYSDTQNISSITINKTTTRILVYTNATSLKIGEYVNITAVVLDTYNRSVPGAELVFTINTTNRSASYTLHTNDDGSATLILSMDSYMIINATITYIGNATYTYSTNSTIITWHPIHTYTSLTASNESPEAGSTIELTVALTDEYGNPVSGYPVSVYVSRDGLTWTLLSTPETGADGVAILQYHVDGAGLYYFKAVFTDPDKGVQGSWRYYSSESSVLTINASLNPVNLEVSSNVTETYVYEAVRLQARLYLANGTGITGATIHFYYYDGESWVPLGDAVTDETGTASLEFLPAETGTYIFMAVYNGSSLYSPATSGNITITILKRPSLIEITGLSPSRPSPGEEVVITVRLTSLATPIVGVRVALFVNNALYSTNTTDSEGYAIFKLALTEPGMYVLKLVFPGTDTINESSMLENITLKYRANLTLNITYSILGNGSILFKLKARLIVNGSPVRGARIYFYRKGSWILIGMNTTDPNGEAVLNWIPRENLEVYVFNASYPGTASTWSAVVTRSVSLKGVLPAPEPPLLPIILLAAVLVVAALHRSGKI